MAKLARSGKAPGQRQLKAGELIRHALADVLIRGDHFDPVLSAASITVTEVRVSPDLKHAVAFVMPLLGDKSAEVLAALKKSRGLFRMAVARATVLKFAPDLDFELDAAFDRSLAIDAVLRSERVRRDLEKDEKADS